MFRAVLLLSSVSALPALLLAAPAPPGKPVFGAGGVVTRAALETISWKRASSGDRELRRLASLGVALHLPRTRFLHGDPVPAYFLVRNFGREEVGLDMRLDLFCTPFALNNSCSLSLIRQTDGKNALAVQRNQWKCGGPGLGRIPAAGHYCVRGDLSQADGGILPPGQYECSWAYAGLRSQVVPFTILPRRDGVVPAVPAPRRIRILEIVRPSAGGAKEPTSGEVELIPQGTGRFATALALGVTGAHHPDLDDLPGRDALLAASAQWVREKGGERIRVTLRGNDEVRGVRLDQVPHLYLHVQESGKESDDDLRRFAERGKDRRFEVVRTPLTIDLPLPRNWRRTLGISEGARLAVIVSSVPIRVPEEGTLHKMESRSASRKARPLWSGLLRTPLPGGLVKP